MFGGDSMSYIEPSSGNVGFSATSMRRRETIRDVQVSIRASCGVIIPTAVKWSEEKTYKIDRAFGSSYDYIHDAMSYRIRIGNHFTNIYRREDGSWFVVPNS